jgi:hypothetical protein
MTVFDPMRALNTDTSSSKRFIRLSVIRVRHFLSDM